MTKKQNIHFEHRSRMKQKLLENNGNIYHPHQLLEMLLFYTIKRKDTNPAAHRLLNRFGNIDGVLNAKIDDLTEVEEIGPVSASLIKAVGEICRRYSQVSEERISFSSTDDLKNYFADNFPEHTVDSILIISVNTQLELIHSESLRLDELEDNPSAARLITQIILKSGADQIAAGIFHLCSPPIPTQSDYRLTRMIAETASAIGAELIDMIICSGKYTFSMKETGAFSFSF